MSNAGSPESNLWLYCIGPREINFIRRYWRYPTLQDHVSSFRKHSNISQLQLESHNRYVQPQAITGQNPTYSYTGAATYYDLACVLPTAAQSQHVIISVLPIVLQTTSRLLRVRHQVNARATISAQHTLAISATNGVEKLHNILRCSVRLSCYKSQHNLDSPLFRPFLPTTPSSSNFSCLRANSRQLALRIIEFRFIFR
jgi:hypothetical protein